MKKTYWGDKGDPSPARESTTVHVEDLMIQRVVSLTRHQTVGHARELMQRLSIHSIPIVDGDGEPVGILTSADLLSDVKDETLIGQVMTREVCTVARYAAPAVAAQLMRKHKIHHLVVTDEQKVVGVLSSYDLLQLVEEKRYVAKNRAAKTKKRVKRH